MAATRITVSVKGPAGLDDPDRLLSELEAATNLSWTRQPVEREDVLTGGIVEIVLVVMLTKVTEIAVEQAFGATRQAVARWRKERLDPPEISIARDVILDTDTASDAADPTGPER